MTRLHARNDLAETVGRPARYQHYERVVLMYYLLARSLSTSPLREPPPEEYVLPIAHGRAREG